MNNLNSEYFKTIEQIWQYVRTIKNKKLNYQISIELNLIKYIDFN